MSLTFFLSYLTPNYLQEATPEVSDISLVYYLWAWIFAIQIVVFIPSFIFKTEHYYDLTGGITFISAIISSLFIRSIIYELDLRSILVSVKPVLYFYGFALFRQVN